MNRLYLIFIILSILFSFFPSSPVSAEDWYNSSWLYRKVITISHSDDGAQTNYQVKIMIGENSDCNGHILSSFNDLRFTTSDGATLCDYWIENVSGVTPGLVATVWIEVPSIAAHPNNTTIYMYYGNSGANAVSNFNNTFSVLTTTLLGIDTAGGNGNSGQMITLDQWSCLYTGFAVGMKAYTLLASDTIKLALYSDSAGANADSIIVAESSNLSSVSNGWVSYNFASPFKLNKTTYYWISSRSAKHYTIAYYNAGHQHWKSYSYSSALPNPAGTYSSSGAYENVIAVYGAKTQYLIQEPVISLGGEETILPTVTTVSVTDVGKTTVVVNGNVVSDGGSSIVERGVCYCLLSHGTPDAGDSKSVSSGNLGSFMISMMGLYSGTSYVARSYAINSVGTSYGVSVVFSTLFDSQSWSYVKTITIAHTDDGAQSNYQMKLLVGESSGSGTNNVNCNSHGLSSFNDLRFTTSDGSILCDYWIESRTGTTPNQVATVWIEIPSIAAHPTDTTIYMYYGNPNAEAVSNGAKTFIDFDDFEISPGGVGWTNPDSAIDFDNTLQKWGGSQSLQQTGYDAHYSRSARSVSASSNKALRMRFRNTATSGRQYFNQFWGNANHYTYWGISYTYDLRLAGVDTLANVVSGTWHLMEIKNFNETAHTVSLGMDGVFYSGSLLNNASDAMVLSCGYSSNLNYIDDFIVRNYTINEPTWSNFGGETLGSPDVGNSPGTSSAGKLSAGGNYVTGLTYFTVVNNSAFAVNIIITGTDMTGGTTWTLADDGDPGVNIVGIKSGVEGGDYTIIVKKTSGNTLISNLAAAASKRWGWKMFAPISFSDYVAKSGTITLTAIAY